MPDRKKETRRSLFPLYACLIVYLLAAAVGITVTAIVFHSASGSVSVPSSIAAVAAGDLAATIVVFIFSMIFNNSSVYDPYWSVVPPFLAAFWIVMGLRAGHGLTLGGAIVVALLLLWAGRLTLNWGRGWRGFAHEDWRYVDFRKSAGHLYWIVSFLGIHLFPTILVFLGCFSLVPALAEPVNHLDPLWIAGVFVIAAAILIEARADRELFEFKRSDHNPGDILDSGLWRLSRHPNYFGEVLFWWGLYLAGLGANPSFWWTIVGPLAITALFLFVSVPMMEKHMIERHPNYERASFERSRFVPWFRR